MAIGRPRKFDDETLLDRAVDLLWREGPLALSLNEIAVELNTTKPALARRYGGKESFLAAALKRYHERVDAPVQAAISDAGSVEEVARAFLGAYLAVLSQKPVGPASGCLLAAATDACANQKDTALSDTVKALNGQSRASLVFSLKRVQANDAERLAQYLYGQSVALAFLSRTGADENALCEFMELGLSGVLCAENNDDPSNRSQIEET